jgi:hypothetical protein
MRSTTSALIAAATLGLLLVGSGSAAAPVSARNSSVVVTPDANRTKAFFIKIVGGPGSFAIPKLNGLTGTITYENNDATQKAVKIYTAWGTYGTPPPASNGGAILAYVVVHLTTPPAFFSGGEPKSSVSYAELMPSKTYSMDLFDCTGNHELGLENIGSPSKGMLTFYSPLDGINTYVDETLCLELVQNP